ncbi:hypothetical protein IG193_04855 [Infirmifilum lucidum]|uniref:Uncharacterized protein n=1 Tax=Infirmifilum lucidum TaxID=2776706 RepID=A0A7L9FER9_9CREN|nr:hypothetical protein [Infirmifilum lucidum]QOJ78121.1 hypothetical protein IG193_04855 [Infirmifilum lucidum]
MYDDKPLLARVISSAFYLSHGIRRNVSLIIYLGDAGYKVVFLGDKLKHIHVDEQSLTGILKKIQIAVNRKPRHVKVHDGVFVEQSPSLTEHVDYLVTHEGAPLEKSLHTCPEKLSLVIEHGIKLSASAAKVRVTSRPKPVDVTLAILNIKLDRLCGPL